MTVANFKIGRREYVVIPRRDFERMRAELGAQAAQDRVDALEAVKRLRDPHQKSIPWSQAKKRLGLA